MKLIRIHIIVKFTLILLTLALISPISAITNPGFETGDFGDWFDVGGATVGTDYAYSGNYGCRVKTPGAPSSRVGQRITLGNTLSFEMKILDVTEDDVAVWWQGVSPSGNFMIEEYASTQGWQREYVDTSTWNGYYGNLMFVVTSYESGAEFWLDDVSTTESPPGLLSGYVKNNYADEISSATITINASGGETTSNDTGYYSFSDVTAGSYLISATSPTCEDYNTTINVNGDTEHNITMTRLTPDLISGPWILQEGQYHLMLGWTENTVVDSAKIYQGSSTNLIYTKDTFYTALGSHTVGNLDCGSPYTFWIQPMDGAVAGSKYEISGETDPCDVSAVVPIFTATPTPTETPPPDEEEEEEGLIEIIDEIIDNTIEELSELFDETIIEPTKVVIEEVITHISTTFNWVLLGFVYLSVLAGRVIKVGGDVLELIVDTALYGTIAMIFILFLSFIGFSVIFSNELIAVVIFVVVGFVFGLLPEIISDRSVQE